LVWRSICLSALALGKQPNFFISLRKEIRRLRLTQQDEQTS